MRMNPKSYEGSPEVASRRVVLHWGCRIAGRAFMLMHPAGALHYRFGPGMAAALGALDLFQARQLQRGRFDTPRGQALRIALEALDGAVVTYLAPAKSFKWSSGGGAQVPSASLVAMTAYERGALRALAASAPVTVAIGAMRAVRGESIELGDLVTWPIWDVALGKLFSIMEKSQLRRRSERESVRRRAAGEQAFLAGRRAWVQSHLRLLDRLERFGLRIVDIPGVQLASAQQLDELAKTVRLVDPPTPGRPAFLAALLQQYEDDRRITHHIDDRLALVELPPAEGQLLLTAHQTRRLWDALTMLGVAGELTVQVTEQINRGLDTEVTLHIISSHTLNGGPPAEANLKLPTGSPAWHVEFITLGLPLAGAHLLTMSRPAPGQIPLPITLSSFAMSCIAAGLAEWQVRRKGSEVAPGAALASLGPAFLIAVFGTPRMRGAYTAQGVAIYPGVFALTGTSYALGFYAARMTATLKGALAVGVAAQVTGSWLSSARPRSALAFGAELILAGAGMVAGHLLAAAFDKLSTRVVSENEQQTANHAQAQRMAGWSHQHREAELLHELAQRTMDQAQPETQRQRDKIRNARQEHNRLAEDLSRAATPPPDIAS